MQKDGLIKDTKDIINFDIFNTFTSSPSFNNSGITLIIAFYYLIIIKRNLLLEIMK